MRFEGTKLKSFAPSHSILSMTAINEKGSTPVYVVMERNKNSADDELAIDLDDPKHRWFLSVALADSAWLTLSSGHQLTKRNQGHSRPELIEFIAAIH